MGHSKFIKIIIGICVISLTGCGSQKPGVRQNPEEPPVPAFGTAGPEHSSGSTEDSTTEKDADENPRPADVPDEGESAPEQADYVKTLPDTGSGLMDFVPEGWALLDSVELDFNEDGVPDYVGVLDMPLSDAEDEIRPDFMPPRILFAIASDGTGRYRLDFQDINLIRTREEGGVYGDPYEPLTAEGTSFTTHAYGGSAWKWSEADTYTYDEGVWRRTMSESSYGYGPYVTSYRKDDWESGIGIRKERSDDFDEMEKYWDSEDLWEDGFDVEYEISLDEPLTLYQAGMSWWLAPERVTDWSVDAIVFSEDVELSEAQVKRPDEMYLSGGCNEDCVLYVFRDQESSVYYLAMYRFQDRKLAVLAESDSAINDAEVYKGKIYYSTEIVETITYRQTQDGQEEPAEEEDITGVCLNRMDMDGSGKETIFEYRYPGTDQEIMESRPPYMALIYEISGDELVAEVYLGNEPHPFYRMGIDGSGLRRIGQVPAES